jgi:dephospho-CoA kinase
MKIGITGGIGAGKSYVAKIIKKNGYAVIDADIVAKQIMLEDESVKELIINTFGKDAYSGNQLNTSYIALKAFNSIENIKRLNSIVHPPLVAKIDELLNNELKNSRLAFVEAALIYEAEIDAVLDYVLLIKAEEKVRIKRAMERSGLSEDEVRARIKFQMPEKEKEKLADFTIHNNSDMSDLEAKTKLFLTIFESMATKNNKLYR